MKFHDWLFGDSALGFIKHWTPERAQKYERETLTRLGRVAEPSYDWHAKWLKAQRRKQEGRQALPFKRSA